MSNARLDSLDTFVHVAECKNFSRAADAMGVSKAHVSRQITRLEARLGVQLLRRSTRSVTLTPQGQAFYQRVRESLSSIDEAERAVMDLQETPRGTLYMTVAGVFGENYLVPAAAEFMHEYPELSVNIDFTDRQVDLINEGYDVAIRSGVLEDSSLVARRITSRKIVTCASPDYLARHNAPKRVGDLKHHNCLIGSIPYWHFRGSDGKHQHVSVSGNWYSNNGYALLQAAQNGLGIAQLPEFYLHDALATHRLQSVLDEFQPTDNGVWAVYPRNRHLSPKVRLFVEFLITKYANY